jgi:hypothetical protein
MAASASDAKTAAEPTPRPQRSHMAKFRASIGRTGKRLVQLRKSHARYVEAQKIGGPTKATNALQRLQKDDPITKPADVQALADAAAAKIQDKNGESHWTVLEQLAEAANLMAGLAKLLTGDWRLPKPVRDQQLAAAAKTKKKKRTAAAVDRPAESRPSSADKRVRRS